MNIKSNIRNLSIETKLLLITTMIMAICIATFSLGEKVGQILYFHFH